MMLVFLVLALLLIGSATAVVLFKNPIYSALALVLNLLSVAGVFASLDAHFLAAVQIIVYAGAIMVLVVFVLMLLNAKSEPTDTFKPVYAFFGVLSGAIFVLLLGKHFVRGFGAAPSVEPAMQGSVSAIGELLYSRYVFAFESASLLIMAAIVGAVILARRRYRVSMPQEGN